METKKCPYCSEEIQKQAKVCKHCGTDIKKKQKEESLKRRNRNAVIFLAILTVVGFGYAGMTTPPQIQSSGYKDCSFTDESKVKRYLKSPSKAEFVSCYKEGEMIKGTVDSQNGFGAIIRSSFTCNGDECVVY